MISIDNIDSCNIEDTIRYVDTALRRSRDYGCCYTLYTSWFI